MSHAEQEAAGARVRWWVVGPFSREPEGRRFRVTQDTYAEELARAGEKLRMEVPERLGAGERRAVEVGLVRLRSFQVAEVVATVPELRALRALAEELERQPAEAAVAGLEAVVGVGRLSASVGAALREKAAAREPGGAKGGNGMEAAEPSEAPAAPAPVRQEDAVDALFSQVEAARAEDRAKAGVDAFLRSMGNRAPAPAGAPGAEGVTARALVEEVVEATARDVLAHPVVARLESAWRGLKLLVEQCPASSGMVVEVVDVEREALVEAVERALPEEPFERPDALFVVEPTGDVAWLGRLAELGERAQLPVVVAVEPSLFGGSRAGELPVRVEETRGGLPEEWEALRAEESSRWLCAVTPRVAVAVEGKGARRRVCFSSPVFPVAAMLAASFHATGGFARILGRPGAFQGPAAWELPEGREAGVAVPTEAFLPIRAQQRLAELGVLGLGSGRDTDVVQLAAAPMVYGGAHAVPLPAQVLTGRLVRFSQWVCAQLPPGAGGEEVAALFSEAAAVFLFGGAAPAGRVRGDLVEEKGGRGVRVSAVVHPEHAGMPLELGFTLPLRR
jgi:hypothetical protein